MIINGESRNGQKCAILEGFLWIHHKEAGDDDSVSSLESSDSFGGDDDEEAVEEYGALKRVESHRITPTRSSGRRLRCRALATKNSCRQLQLHLGPNSDHEVSRLRRTAIHSNMRKNTSDGCLWSMMKKNVQLPDDAPSVVATDTICSRWSSQPSDNSFAQDKPRVPSRKSSGDLLSSSPSRKSNTPSSLRRLRRPRMPDTSILRRSKTFDQNSLSTGLHSGLAQHSSS